MTFTWNLPFLEPHSVRAQLLNPRKYALIILNQPFTFNLLKQLWDASSWKCCADGGANRLHDTLNAEHDVRTQFLPDLIKGDLDSLRNDVREYYQAHGVPVVHDRDQNSSDLMKCITALSEKERAEGSEFDIIILGGLSGRLDQTIHTLSQLHKLRKTRERVFSLTDENVAWVLNEVYLGITCGLLPVGIDHTMLTTRGLEWNLTDAKSCFDGLVSTSNHLVPGEDTVYIKTTKPLLWTVELRVDSLTF
ncbi:hypothetical protein NM688_g4345 [Phlebia brevispora]|uniref:Uncharacterized protein n=1 Tax=Phlebia brevispora TaxID=194682 RepID=A0ACC1T348_9APHY|nr:hypothetical protein NM688_g4345 [Phlebia brevispora]